MAETPSREAFLHGALSFSLSQIVSMSSLASGQTRESILRYIRPSQGNIEVLFDGKLHLPAGTSKSAWIGRDSVPGHSTEFWMAGCPLNFIRDGKGKPYFRYQTGTLDIKVKYVGYQTPVQQLPSGTLLRMSLARWWDMEGTTEDRCYLQLSGWWLSP